MRKEVDQYIELARKFKKLEKEKPNSDIYLKHELYKQCTKIYDKLDDKERAFAQKALAGGVLEGLGAQGQMIDTGDEVSIIQKAISKLPSRVQALIKPEQKYKVVSALGDTATLAVSGMKINLPTSFLNKPITWESLKENTMKIKKSTLKKAIHEAVLVEVTTRELDQLKGKEIAMRYKKVSTGEVKTYFGRVARTSGENVYVGCLGKGLRAFRISNIQNISPANLKAEQIAELDEMCGTKHKDEVVNEAKKRKFQKATITGRRKYETQATVHRVADRMAAAKKKNKNEACPPGFSGTVKAMKKHPEFEKEDKKLNPYAIAWAMKNKGYKSHKTASGENVKEGGPGSGRKKVDTISGATKKDMDDWGYGGYDDEADNKKAAKEDPNYRGKYWKEKQAKK